MFLEVVRAGYLQIRKYTEIKDLKEIVKLVTFICVLDVEIRIYWSRQENWFSIGKVFFFS